MADAGFNEYTDYIWDYLYSFIGNDFGVAGMMGNIWAESNCTPWACEPSLPKNTCMTYIANVDNGTVTRYQFITYGCSPSGGSSGSSNHKGFGLCQWTYTTRKAGLYDSKGSASIGDISMQLAWLQHELETSYIGVLNTLRNATSVRQASDVVLIHFESPADTGEAVQRLRAKYSQTYFDHYAGGTTGHYISIEIEGNGAATAFPNPAESGQPVQIEAVARSPDIFLYWEVETVGVALDAPADSPVNSFTMIDEMVSLIAHFTGETPPPPPPPTGKAKHSKKKMPIWMYPIIRSKGGWL
ncbi:MAG: hypothetical protein IIZ87_03065 [Selenomonas sp.]|nr:hypothetical protein [Selenomonas sp.]